MTSTAPTLLFLSGLLLSNLAESKDNGRSDKPPMGWRSWNLFGKSVNQQLIQSQMDGIVSRSRLVDGVPTSLADLGYVDVGLDDAWQLCGDYGGDMHYTYHNADGTPVIDTSLFPDFKAMTNYAHNLNITAGWYGNNCMCHDHCDSKECYAADVAALLEYGFDSVKLDNCGSQTDLQLWSDQLDEQGGSKILIENCHWGETVPTRDWCPWNYYRSSGDVRASYSSILENLMSVVPFADAGLSYPGCWAYPDMLEVGCADGPGGDEDEGLTHTEAQTHFGAWCIVSSPLILSHDMNNTTVTDEIWDIITNKEAIAINQAYIGDSGSLFKESVRKIHFLRTDYAKQQKKEDGKSWFKLSFLTGKHAAPGTTDAIINEDNIDVDDSRFLTVGAWQQWAKAVPPPSKVSGNLASAVFIINNDAHKQTVTLNFNEIPAFSGADGDDDSVVYTVRDVWGHTDLPSHGAADASANAASAGGNRSSRRSDWSMDVELQGHGSGFYVVERVVEGSSAPVVTDQ